MRRTYLVLLAICAVTICRADDPPGLFPFVLPWDDDSPGITNVSSWLDAPAGQHGPVRADANGDLRVGDQPIRFFGTDQSHSANFPLKPDAEKIARRLAKFGINILRFHSTGQNWGTAPTLVEGIPAKLTLPCPAARVMAWVLDERGQRREKLPVQTADDGHAVLRIGPESRTLWYEVAVAKP